MTLPASVLIVGAGLAGSRCAETLRAEGFGGRIILAGEEAAEPYERPALSKELLAGEKGLAQLRLRPGGHWAAHHIELLLGARVTHAGIDRGEALLADGRAIPWDALVLATGARPRSLSGTLPRGIHVLRTLTDALALRRWLGRGHRLVVVGAGFVGTEVASTALRLGVEVTLVDPAPVPFRRTLGPAAGEILRDRYRRHGVDLRLGSGVAGFRSEAGGSVTAVELSDGGVLACDAVLVAVGAEPNTGLLNGSVQTDAAGRTTVPGVYACGDVAAVWRRSQGRHARVEHWTDAARQGAIVARAILGDVAPAVEEAPFFWSDQFGLRLQCIGHLADHAHAEPSGAEDSFRVDYFDRDRRLVGALVANRPAEVASLRRELAA